MDPPQVYRPRPIRCTGIWAVDGWRLKCYGIAYGREQPRPLVASGMEHVSE